MPTVIDSLIVRLGLDPKELDKKAPASTRKLKDLEQQGKKTEGEVKQLGATAKESSSGFETLAKSVTGFLALIGGTMAIRHFIDDQVEMNAQLERMSKNLGINVSTLSAWGNAVEEVGGSAQGLQGTMDMLSKSQTDLMLTGQSSLIPFFSALGLSLADVNGKARPVDAILLDLADRFSRMDRTTANNMGRMMGIDPDTMNLLLQGRKELELTIARQKEHNAVTKAQAEQAVKLQRAIVDVKQTFNALGRDLLQRAAPALEAFANWLQRVGEWAQRNGEFIADFAKVLGAVAAAVTLIGVAASPLALVTAGVVALAAAVALLWQDYQTWKRGGDSLIDWSKWQPGIDAAVSGVHALTGAIDGLKSTYKAWLLLKNGNVKGAVNEYINGGGPTILDRFKKKMAERSAGRSAAPVTADAARAEAQRVSKKTGIPADILYAQWAHETGNFTNRGAKQLNNLAGVNVPGGKGQDYRTFKSLDDFGDYYSYLMRPGGRYAGAANARTPEQFAAVLKSGGYMADSAANYANGMRREMPGSTSTTHIGEIKVYSAATDAKGIAQDMGRSMDYLFTSQANPGLF